ncbi:glycosyltransferase family 9 protein [Actinoplanes friuliensis]|uniref:Putative glycosyltransferase n=1 Tax=Actinoplanes friuliensis DSM 7358 TaxID=1246995 RepID=U5VXB2_9ACTN|nr:glycosyltransferase family 9 protein [Actinoplanes friuliensis]AGZ41593.1 putative glycosyltransferase [Actinoplanes friuliensis DSM 7358]
MILVLRALGVGDLATAVPALRAVQRAARPGERVALAAPAWLSPLVELVGGLDLVPTAGLTGVTWDLPAPRLAVNLHGCGPESHRLLASAHPGVLWAFANAGAGHPGGPAWSEEDHEVHRWCRLTGHYGAPADPADLALTVPSPVAATGLTIVHPGAKSPTRRWPARRYAEVARSLVARGHDVVVTGSDDEAAAATWIAGEAGLAPGAVLAGRTGVGELAALVAHARLVISGDTGIAHLASAYATPSVVLFGPMSPGRWGPPPRAYHRAIWHGTRAEPGDAPGPDPHPALLRITAREVLEAADAAVSLRCP